MEKAGSGWLAGSTPLGTGMGVRAPSPSGLCSVTWAARYVRSPAGSVYTRMPIQTTVPACRGANGCSEGPLGGPDPQQPWPSCQKETAQGPQAWGWGETQAPTCPPFCLTKSSHYHLGQLSLEGPSPLFMVKVWVSRPRNTKSTLRTSPNPI